MRLGRYARGLPLPYEDSPKYIHYSILGAFYFFFFPFIPFLRSSALLFQLSWLEQLFLVTGSTYSSVFLLPCSVLPFYLSSLAVVQVLFEQQLHSKGSSTQSRLFILNPVLSSSILLTFGETVIGRKRLLIKTSTSVNHLIPIVPLFIYLFDFFSYISRAMDSLRKIRKREKNLR